MLHDRERSSFIISQHPAPSDSFTFFNPGASGTQPPLTLFLKPAVSAWQHGQTSTARVQPKEEEGRDLFKTNCSGALSYIYVLPLLVPAAIIPCLPTPSPIPSKSPLPPSLGITLLTERVSLPSTRLECRHQPGSLLLTTLIKLVRTPHFEVLSPLLIFFNKMIDSRWKANQTAGGAEARHSHQSRVRSAALQTCYLPPLTTAALQERQENEAKAQAALTPEAPNSRQLAGPLQTPPAPPDSFCVKALRKITCPWLLKTELKSNHPMVLPNCNGTDWKVYLCRLSAQSPVPFRLHRSDSSDKVNFHQLSVSQESRAFPGKISLRKCLFHQVSGLLWKPEQKRKRSWVSWLQVSAAYDSLHVRRNGCSPELLYELLFIEF